MEMARESLCHVAPALATDWVDFRPHRVRWSLRIRRIQYFCDGTWVKLFVYIAQTNLRRASMKRLIVEAEWELVP